MKRRNIFNQIKITDYTNFSKDQKAKVESEAIANGLLTEAMDKAKTVIQALLEQSGEAYETFMNKLFVYVMLNSCRR